MVGTDRLALPGAPGAAKNHRSRWRGAEFRILTPPHEVTPDSQRTASSRASLEAGFQ